MVKQRTASERATPRTIGRGHKLRQTRLRKEMTKARVYSISNDFNGAPADIEKVWEYYDSGHGTLRYSGDKYHIDVNENLWYELS